MSTAKPDMADRKDTERDDLRRRVPTLPSRDNRDVERNDKCIAYPRVQNSKHPRRWEMGVKTAVAIVVILQITAFAVLLCYMAPYYTAHDEQDAPDTHTMDRFESCRATIPDKASCAQWLERLENSQQNGPGANMLAQTTRFGLVKLDIPSASDWCHRISCLADFTVIRSITPSEDPAPSAFMHWFFIGDAAWFTLVHLRTQLLFRPHAPSSCRGASRALWLTQLYALASMVAWWRVVSRNTSALGAKGISPYCWAVTVRAALSLALHPFSCAFGGFTGLRRRVMVVLAVVGAAQMVAGVHVLVLARGAFLGPYEGCVEEMARVAGGGKCSPAEMCGRSWMFEFSAVGPYRGRHSFKHVFPDAVMAFFIVVTASEMLGLAFQRTSNRMPSEKGGQAPMVSRDAASAGRWWLMTQCITLVGLVVAAAGMTVYQTFLIWRDGGAPVYLDLACDAIHLHMHR